ncbi:MAG: FxsA family protein [Methylotenera sp.]|uniref:FxsA family protein n=1 Tax=Methylotenera sp. TaxID=2051956 RepID=UPI00248920B7|nr:FxsA family protein [Methylotenera sp.]MDI1309013.1 FxsA family protein [Methylotenera sp.]
MRLIVTLAFLSFPIGEIWILINLFQQYGWWVLLYLVAMVLLGLQLIREEKLLFSGRIMQSLSQGSNPMKALFGSARHMFAGILLIIPGVLTDVVAVVLLLIPVDKSTIKSSTFKQKAANDDVIEGEFHREE